MHGNLYRQEDSLEHYGVLGMKWGVRRTPEQLGHKSTNKLDKYKEKQQRNVDKRYGKLLDSVNEGLKKYPNSTTMKLEKKQLDSLIKAESDSISKLSVKDMNKEKIKRGLTASAGVLATSGGVASAVAFGTASAFNPALPVLGLGYVAGVGGGTALIGASLLDFTRSDYAKALEKKGNEYIAGATKRLGVDKMHDIDKKIEKKFGKATVDRLVNSEVSKKTSSLINDALAADALRNVQRTQTQMINQQMQQDLFRIQNEINMQTTMEMNNLINQQIMINNMNTQDMFFR